MSPKRSLLITELLGNLPPPTAARCLCTSFPSQRCAQRTVTAAKADVQRHSPGAARSAPPGHVLQSAHSAVPRLGPGPAPPHRAARDTRPLPAGPRAAALPQPPPRSGAPLPPRPRRSPPPAGLRLLRPPRSGRRRAPRSLPSAAAARAAARTAANRRRQRRRAARTRPRGTGRRGLAAAGGAPDGPQ